MDVTHSEAAPATSSDEPIPPPLDFVQATDDDITTAKPRDESSAIVSEPEKTPAPSVIPQNPNPQDEIDKAFIVCSDIIDKPPDDYRYDDLRSRFHISFPGQSHDRGPTNDSFECFVNAQTDSSSCAGSSASLGSTFGPSLDRHPQASSNHQRSVNV